MHSILRRVLLSSLVFVAPVFSAEPAPSVEALVIRIPIGLPVAFEDARSLRVWPEELCSTRPGEKQQGLVLTCSRAGKGTLEVTHLNGKLSRDMLDVTAPAAPKDITPTPGETIALTPRQTANRTFEGLIRLAVGDAAIATATLGGANQVSFTGQAPGDTTALLWMTDGKLLSVRLHVTSR